MRTISIDFAAGGSLGFRHAAPLEDDRAVFSKINVRASVEMTGWPLDEARREMPKLDHAQRLVGRDRRCVGRDECVADLAAGVDFRA